MGSLISTVFTDRVPTHGLAEEIVKEVDSDNAVIQYLKDSGQDDMAQFWLDMRMSRSFMAQFLSTSTESTEHDTASIVANFQKTEEVLDINHFIEQKQALMEVVRQEMGMGERNHNLSIMSDYPDAMQAIRYNENLDIKKYEQAITVKPQGIMHVVKTLLAEDKLDGMQKWEAENYMESMERLGYEPDADYSYEAQMRSVFEDIEKDIATQSAVAPSDAPAQVIPTN